MSTDEQIMVSVMEEIIGGSFGYASLSTAGVLTLDGQVDLTDEQRQFFERRWPPRTPPEPVIRTRAEEIIDEIEARTHGRKA